MHEATGTGRDGIDALRLAEASSHYGLRARGVATELDDLRGLPRGSVLHWGAAHFVVLDSTSRRGVTVVDPAVGQLRVAWEAANDLYSGVAIIFEPTDTFPRAGGRRAPGAVHHARLLLTRSSGIGKVLATSVVVQNNGPRRPGLDRRGRRSSRAERRRTLLKRAGGGDGCPVRVFGTCFLPAGPSAAAVAQQAGRRHDARLPRTPRGLALRVLSEALVGGPR